MSCASPMRLVMFGELQPSLMRSHILQTTRDTVVGAIGTVGSLELSEWNAVVGIFAGLATLTYMIVRIMLALREWRAGRKPKAELPKQDNFDGWKN